VSQETRKSRGDPPGDPVAPEHPAATPAGREGTGELAPESPGIGVAQLITAISRDFISMAPDQIDRGIEAALRAVGEYAGVDRAFLFQLSDDLSLLVNSHEWCADPLHSQLAKLQGLPTHALPWARSRLARGEPICVRRISDLPPEARAEKNTWESVGSKSLIILPLEAAGNLLGAVGLDTVHGEREWSGEVIALLGTVSEILANALDRKNREEALRESEERFRTLVENAYDLITNMRSDGRLLFASPNHPEILGWEAAEALGTGFANFVHPEDRKLVQSRFQQILETGVAAATFRVRHKDGTYRWLECTGRSYETPKGEARIVSISRDITERRRAEERITILNRLKEHLIRPAPLEEKLERITKAVVDMFAADFARIWLTRPGDLCSSGCMHATVTEGPHVCRHRDRCLHLKASSGRYTHTDGRMHGRVPFGCYKIGRVAAAEEVGFLTNDVTHDPRVHDHEWARALGLVSFAGYRLLSHEGAPIGVLALFSKRPLSSEEGAMLQTVAATTSEVVLAARSEEEKLSLERQMQHAQKLESLGVLAGGIAHDFNNILMAILGNADLALQRLPADEPVREHISEIEKASRRAAGLARQMLAYSGKGSFVVEAIHLNEFVAEMAHLLEVSISKKATLVYDFAADLPTFNGDSTQVRQIIMNLITNASEALGAEGGVISLSTGAMHCDRAHLDAVDTIPRVGLDEPLPEGMYVQLEVRDTGCGMDAETIGRIFDPFFSTKFTGRGLGMSAVLGIVRGHRGAIQIQSEAGRGSAFRVLFPAFGRPREMPTSEPAEADDWRGSGTILLIDDEEVVLNVVQRILESMGFQVLCVNEGAQALELFRARGAEIVCVLLDLTMPGLDGEQVFREIRRLRPDTRVILSSGYDESDVTQRFASEGLAGFIQKPYRSASLRAKLKQVLGSPTDRNHTSG
jgi:PAS domain S-box-containing protein